METTKDNIHVLVTKTDIYDNYTKEELPVLLQLFNNYSDEINLLVLLGLTSTKSELRLNMLRAILNIVGHYINLFGMYHDIDELGGITILAENGHPGLKLYILNSVLYGMLHNKKLKRIIEKQNKDHKPGIKLRECPACHSIITTNIDDAAIQLQLKDTAYISPIRSLLYRLLYSTPSDDTQDEDKKKGEAIFLARELIDKAFNDHKQTTNED